MAPTTLRAAIATAVRGNLATVLKALKAEGIVLTPAEEAALKAGDLRVFSDRQLADRFNARVLGVLGIDVQHYAPLAAKTKQE